MVDKSQKDSNRFSKGKKTLDDGSVYEGQWSEDYKKDGQGI